MLVQSRGGKINANGELAMLGQAKHILNDKSRNIKYSFQLEGCIQTKVYTQKHSTMEVNLDSYSFTIDSPNRYDRDPTAFNFTALAAKFSVDGRGEEFVLRSASSAGAVPRKAYDELIGQGHDILEPASPLGYNVEDLRICFKGYLPQRGYLRITKEAFGQNFALFVLANLSGIDIVTAERILRRQNDSEKSQTLKPDKYQRSQENLLLNSFFGDYPRKYSSRAAKLLLDYIQQFNQVISQDALLENGDTSLSRESKNYLYGESYLNRIENFDLGLLERRLRSCNNFKDLVRVGEWVYHVIFRGWRYIPLAIKFNQTVREYSLNEIEMLSLALGSRVFGLLSGLESSAYVVNEYMSKIRYLAPLRARPQPAYSVERTSEWTPVGLDGASTAAFLYQRLVVQGSLEERRLRTLKLNNWIKDLNIGSGLRVNAPDKFGYSLEIDVRDENNSEAEVWRDLTQIGTGVSQCLPILALLLDAPKNGLLLIEQPELHLHPAMQGRLMEILASASNEFGIICETHSEYFISRLRRMMAIDFLRTNRESNENIPTEVVSKISDDPSISPANVGFYWTEEFRRGHKSQGYNLIELKTNDVNDISYWPDGFFDSAEKDLSDVYMIKSSPRRSSRVDGGQ